VKDAYPGTKGIAWQEGYAAFSVGLSQRQRTVEYILAKAEHHKTASLRRTIEILAAHVSLRNNSAVPLGTSRVLYIFAQHGSANPRTVLGYFHRPLD